MATPNRLRDARMNALDLGELSKILKHKKAPEPAEAKPFNRPGLKASKIRLPWTYDLEYGWTPELETLEPRPPLNVPPYYAERFQFQTAGLKQGGHTYIMIDLRQFPRASRVFVRLPAQLVRPARLAELQQGAADAPDGTHATVPATPEMYNKLFAETEAASVNADTVLVELEPRTRVILDQLQLDADPVDIEIRYAVLRESVWPKTQYVIHFAQLIDGCLVGEFEHLFQAYHHYDIPIVGDKRIKVAHRRSSPDVSAIPPLALAFFDDWKTAAAYGYDPAPQSFARHFRPEHASTNLTRRILEFFNNPDLTVEALVQRIEDNAFVDAEGEAEAQPRQKVGITRKTAQRVLDARDGLPQKRFRHLPQIDAVRGVGPDTMSDIITSFLSADEAADDDQWHPDEEIVQLLSPVTGVR